VKKKKKNQLQIYDNQAEFLIYKTENGKVKLDVRLEDETIWLTQRMMADLFQSTKQNIGQHLVNIFSEGELEECSVVKKFFTTAADGKKYKTNFYNLDAVISVGYRVKSIIATRFRIWATERLKEYIVKGFTMDDERLKNPPSADSPVPDYFDEMLTRIRDIRSSERRMYLRVREIFAMAADYDVSRKETTTFFSIIQNKLHFASTGMTAAEIIHSRASAQSPNMGLTSWQRDEIRKTDVTIAKNYLRENEVEELNRIITMWLDFAEDQARRRRQVFMNDWEAKLDSFLTLNERRILDNAGSISKEQAETHAKDEFNRFAVQRRQHKEQLGEADSLKMLEEAVKQIEGKTGKNTHE